MRRGVRARTLWVLAPLLVLPAPPLAALQERPELRVVWEAGDSVRVPVATDRGYAAVDVRVLERLGWTVTPDGQGVRLSGVGGVAVSLRRSTPFFRWNDRLLHFADPVYESGGAVMVPLQLLSDFLPRRLPDLYAFDGRTLRFRSGTAAVDGASGAHGAAAPAVDAPAPRTAPAPAVSPPPTPDPVSVVPVDPQPYAGPRVVVIDAGHGGEDPGSISRAGLREKTVALGVSLALAERLRQHEDLEVHLLRDDDTFIEVWDRGALATDIRGDRPGVFVSIHANSFNSPARGFETYFLSEARTEHERRVAAIENAPVRIDNAEVGPSDDLGFILRELRNFDHSHWSNLLADFVQQEIDVVHPGPNRGVKQAPLAVLTNALMPSVLVEIGYLSHAEEARLLQRPDFQKKAGYAIADAVVRFFERYPPGAGTGAGERP